jgi:hypothetical protein
MAKEREVLDIKDIKENDISLISKGPITKLNIYKDFERKRFKKTGLTCPYKMTNKRK